MYRYAQRMELAQPSFIRESLKLASDPTLICFAGGNPDPAYFPWEELAQAAQRAITGDWRFSTASPKETWRCGRACGV